MGKTTRPFRYDLNQIPYDYTVEVRNRFQGLDLTECLMNYGRRFLTLYRRQRSRPSPRKRNAKKQNGCLSSVQFSSVPQSCLTLCDHVNCSTPGLPVHHQLLEFTQIHIHRVSDAIQPSHPLSFPSPPAPNPSQHQSFPMSQFL